MLISKKLLMYPWHLPVNKQPPEAESPATLVAESTNAAVYYTIPQDGWYKIRIAAGNGNNGEESHGGVGGSVEHTSFFFAGTRCLLWRGYTGGGTLYPAPKGNGGSGANGGTVGSAGPAGGGGSGYGNRAGGGGGSATGNPGGAGYHGGNGGGGSGFIAVFDTYGQTATERWDDAGFSGDTVVCMVLAGGGGGGVGESSDRAGGGGGGAWGNGGASAARAGGTGPGGTAFGKGADGIGYGNGGNGAWCVRDFSTGTMTSGTAKKINFTSVAALYRYDNQEPNILPPTIEYTEPLELTEPRQEGYRVLLPAGRYYFATKSTNGGPEVEFAYYNLGSAKAFNVIFLPFGEAALQPDSAFNDPIARSSGTATSATPGYVKIVKLGEPTAEENFGGVGEAVTVTDDFGNVTETATTTEDWGKII